MSDPVHALLPLGLVDDPPAPTRQTIDMAYIETLAASIRENGQLQPIGVVQDGERYVVVYGHCRTLACRRLELPTIKAYVYASSSEAMLGAQLAENADRAAVNPVDEAIWFAQLWEALQVDTDELAHKLRKDRIYVEGRLNLLRGDPDVLTELRAGRISLGVAELLNKYDDERDRKVLLSAAAAGGASKRLVAEWLRDRRKLRLAQGGAPASDPALSASTTEPPSPNPLTCVYCEGTEDVYLMVNLWIHKPCWNMLRALLARHFGGTHAVTSVEVAPARR